MMNLEHSKSLENWNEVWLKQASNSKVQQTKESYDDWNKLQKNNNILESFDFSDEKEDQYLKTLNGLDKAQLTIIESLGKAKFEKLLNKPQNEILQFLIQAQIDELEAKGNLSNDDKKLRYNLRKQLIAVEKSETAVKVDRDNKENDLIDAIDETDKKIAELRGVLLYNPKIQKNSKIQTIHGFFDEYEKIAQNPNNLLTLH